MAVRHTNQLIIHIRCKKIGALLYVYKFKSVFEAAILRLEKSFYFVMALSLGVRRGECIHDHTEDSIFDF